MAHRTQTSPLTVRIKFTPGGSDAQSDYDPEWDLISVEAEVRNPRCYGCGDPSIPEKPIVPDPNDSLSILLERPAPGTPICDACAVEEEISNSGVHEMFVEGRDIQVPDYEATWIVKGYFVWDCYTDYEGCTECDADFTFTSDEFVKSAP
jgi:hypothetical protein